MRSTACDITSIYATFQIMILPIEVFNHDGQQTFRIIKMHNVPEPVKCSQIPQLELWNRKVRKSLKMG